MTLTDLCAAVQGSTEGAAGPSVDLERLQAARRGFQGNLGAAVAELSGSVGAAIGADPDPDLDPEPNGSASWRTHASAAGAMASVAAASLFEELLPAGGGPVTGGVLSAARLIQQVRHVPVVARPSPAAFMCFLRIQAEILRCWSMALCRV
jgi:hypothetical protein